MFNKELFNQKCTEIVKEGCFQGHNISNKTELFDIIGEKLHLSGETIKKWCHRGKYIPGNPDYLNDLENLIGVKLWNYKNPKISHPPYSQTCQNSISECYSILKHYVNSDNAEDEEHYLSMRLEIETLKLALPTELFNKIITFIESEISPLVYEQDTIFASMYSEEYGFVDDNGIFNIKGEDEFIQMIGKYIQVMIGVEEKLEAFSVQEFFPILSSNNLDL